VRFYVVFIQKSVYNLEHLMFGYMQIGLRINQHVKPEPSIKASLHFPSNG